MLQKVATSFVVMTFSVFNLITPNIKNNLSCYFPKESGKYVIYPG